MNTPSVSVRGVERQRCQAAWFDGPPQSVAQRLLGCTLVRYLDGQRCSGIIVEVEAYLSHDDPASHSTRGESPKNRSMFQPAGSLYVYSIHSRYCLNVVTESAGVGSAVLIRAIEPYEGMAVISRFRASHPQNLRSSESRKISYLRYLTSGPARLCQALSVNRSLDGTDLITSSEIWLEHPCKAVMAAKWSVRNGPRIGISQAQELPLRWFIDGNQLVSGRVSEHTSGRSWTFI